MSESQETSDYPGSLDTWTTVTDLEDRVEQSDINKMKAAIEAIQTELGTDPAGTLTDVKTRLAIALADNGALANGTSFPVSPTPVDGQIFYRTDLDTVYIYDGSSWESFGRSSEEFTADGTFTAPSGVTLVWVTLCGGGGGGSCVNAQGGQGGGGGGGCIKFPVRVIAGNNYTVTVGDGGAGAAGVTAAGSNGQDSSFAGEDVTLTGGGGSGGGTSASSGGAGGAFSSSEVDSTGAGADQLAGTTGAAGGKLPLDQTGMVFDGGDGGDSTGDNTGGAGGGGSLGQGGAGGNNGAAGNDGDNYGGGGGGGGEDATVGGDGAGGFVKVQW